MCIVRFIHVEDFSDEATAAGFPMAGIYACAANRLTASRSPIVLVPSDPNLHYMPFTALLFTLTYASVTVKLCNVTVCHANAYSFARIQACSDGFFSEWSHDGVTGLIWVQSVLAEFFLQKAVVVYHCGKKIEIDAVVLRRVILDPRV